MLDFIIFLSLQLFLVICPQKNNGKKYTTILKSYAPINKFIQQKVLKDITNINVTNKEDKINLPEKRKTIYDQIGNYFNSLEALQLFQPKSDESVKDCSSQRINLFDGILNNREDVSYIVNKASEDNCKLNSKQSIVMIQRILHLQNAYFIMLSNDVNKPISFKLCCEKGIKQMNEIGIKLIQIHEH